MPGEECRRPGENTGKMNKFVSKQFIEKELLIEHSIGEEIKKLENEIVQLRSAHTNLSLSSIIKNNVEKEGIEKLLDKKFSRLYELRKLKI